MRVIIQRVKQAEVSIDDGSSASIGPGLLVLLGIETEDRPEDAEWLVKKILALRIFPDAEGVMNLSVMDAKGELMIVSQFTLHALTKKGNRPSYIRAARPEIAIPLYAHFLECIAQESGKPPASGKFGAMMDITLTNSGPVTIFIDSKNRA